MATERIVDLAHQRYADRPYEGVIQAGPSAEEQARARRQQAALARLRARAAQHNEMAADILALLGLDE
jgi:hypothetical protein